MNTELFQLMFPIVGMIVLLAAFLTFLLIYVPKAYVLKFVGIPAFLFCAYFSYTWFGSSLGRAVPLPLPEKFVLLGYQAHKPKDIEVWANEGKRTRLYTIPYSEEVREKLQKGMERQKMTGVPQQVKVKPRGGKGRGPGGNMEFDIEVYNFPYEQEMPKDEDHQKK